VATEEQEQTDQETQGQTDQETHDQGGGNRGTAMKAAAAAAATGVAAIAARKALSGRGHDNSQAKNGGSPSKRDTGSLASSMLAGGWDAAKDAILPIAEDAAAAAGEFLAENGPDVVRERIVPRFIQSFNEAGGSR
jgi:hypothetical protein